MNCATSPSYIDHWCILGNEKMDTCAQEKEPPETTLIWGLDKLLLDCDYIFNALPMTPQTDNILGNGKLLLCKGKIPNLK